MLSFGNKEFRNLQEQVEKNAADILTLNYGGAVLSEFGIRVVGQVDDVTDLPDPTLFSEEDVGDAYAVGTETPYELYILTRPFIEGDPLQWFSIGFFPAPGPQGEQGETGATGAQGQRGTGTFSGLGAPSSVSGFIAGDIYIDSTAGGLYKFNGTAWTYTGSVKGPQGSTGPQGPQGEQGIQGPVGPQGAQGEPGTSFVIRGQVASVSNLPSVNSVPDGSAYLVGSAAPYNLYVLVAEPSRAWFNTGAFNDTEIVDVTGTSGTLNTDQYSTLTSSPACLIRVGNEDIFRLNNESSTVLVYNSVDRYGVQKPTEKYIVVTKSTRAWQLYSEGLVVESDLSNFYTKAETEAKLGLKQDTLVSSQNIKTINSSSILGSGNIDLVVPSALNDYVTTTQFNTGMLQKQDSLVSGTNIKTINSASILGSGNILIDTTSAVWGNITGTLSSQTDLQTALDGKMPLYPTEIKVSPISGTNYAKAYMKENEIGVNKISTISGAPVEYAALGPGVFSLEASDGSRGLHVRLATSDDGGYASDKHIYLVSGQAFAGSETNVKIYLPGKSGTIALTSDIVDPGSIPTKTSDLINDSGFITASSLPTKTSDLTNDSGFITSAALAGLATETYVDNAIADAITNTLNTEV